MTAKRSTNSGKGGSTSTRSNSKSGSSSSNRNQNSSKGSSSYDNDYRENDSYSSRGSKGNSSYSDSRSTSKSGDNYSNADTSRGTSSKGGSTRRDSYSHSRSSSSKDSRAYSNDDSSSSKSGATQSDNYNSSSTSKGGSYANDDYSNDSSSKGGNDYTNDYNSEDTYDSRPSKGDDSYNDGYNENNIYDLGSSKGDNNNYDYSDNFDSSNEGQRYEDKSINDPPYDNNNNDDIVAKQSNTNYQRNPSKDIDDDAADMTFTEEEVYGEENSTDNQNTSGSTIERVWLWAGGAVPRTAINNSSAAWWTSRVSLGMTDYVIALNDHDFSNGLGIKSNYVNRGERSNRWNPICEILRITDSHGIAPHLMIFLKPIPEMIRDAARVLQEIVEDSSVVPRSIQLDLEGWWTRRSASQRQAGERAIQQYFKDEWRASRPSLGIGITCIGGVPPAIQGALAQVDFAIPQMYASERNYGRPIRENSVRRHFLRAAEALGNEGKVIAGQTAYSRYVNPEIMKEMLSVLLRLNHSNTGGVSEVAYWSDTHLRNSRANREFFQRLTSLVKREGLNLGNIESL